MSYDHDPEQGCGLLVAVPLGLIAWVFIIRGIRRAVRK